MSQKAFEKVVNFLKENNINFQVFEHEPVHTSEEAARVRGTSLKEGAKALIFMADGKPIMIVVSGDRKVDMKRFKKLFRIRDLRLGTAEEVETITSGIKIGAVHPFGNLHNLAVYADNHLGENKEIIFNVGLHTKSIKIKYQDYFLLANPILGDFSISNAN